VSFPAIADSLLPWRSDIGVDDGDREREREGEREREREREGERAEKGTH
jgi:hypothetical protein